MSWSVYTVGLNAGGRDGLMVLARSAPEATLLVVQHPAAVGWPDEWTPPYVAYMGRRMRRPPPDARRILRRLRSGS